MLGGSRANRKLIRPLVDSRPNQASRNGLRWGPLRKGLPYTDTRACASLGGGTSRMDTRGEFLGRYKGGCQAAMDGSWKYAPMTQSRVPAQRGLNPPSFDLQTLDLRRRINLPWRLKYTSATRAQAPRVAASQTTLLDLPIENSSGCES